MPKLSRALVVAVGLLVVVAGLSAASPDAVRPTAATAASAAQVSPRSMVSSGGEVTCQIRSKGALFCGGDNSWGQLGIGMSKDRLLPRWVGGGYVDVSTSGATTCGIRHEGGARRLYCWGMNTRGQLGIGDEPQKWTPQRVAGRNWKQVSAGWLHTCGVRMNGALFCWGAGNHGQLGNGKLGLRKRPQRIGTATDWLGVTAGGWHTCGIRKGGTSYCWGRNDFGQLGTGNTSRRTRPQKVALSVRIRELDAAWSSTCGIAGNGRMRCWGENDQGQLGDGTRTTRVNPVVAAGGRQWSTLAVGDRHTCGLDEASDMWCWGGNRYGQHGNGTTNRSLKARPVSSGHGWADADAGWLHSCALTKTDEVECWGNNEQGQLWRGDRDDRTTPPGVDAPVQRAGQRALDKNVAFISFNVLGDNHTEPGGGKLNYAPGRIRSEWTTDLLERSGADIVAFQELKQDQYVHLQRTVGSKFDFYPRDPDAGKVVWQSVMWDRNEWQFQKAVDIWVPVLGKTRPNPLVKLRSKLTGRSIWVFNVHNSPGSSAKRVRERRQAVNKEISKINSRRKWGHPVTFIGDMNERREVFCRVTGRTDLRAVNGGSNNGTCKPPAKMRIDWTFVSPEFRRIHWFNYLRGARVNRITDHSILRSKTTIPGR